MKQSAISTKKKKAIFLSIKLKLEIIVHKLPACTPLPCPHNAVSEPKFNAKFLFLALQLTSDEQVCILGFKWSKVMKLCGSFYSMSHSEFLVGCRNYCKRSQKGPYDIARFSPAACLSLPLTQPPGSPAPSTHCPLLSAEAPVAPGTRVPTRPLLHVRTFATVSLGL